MQNGFPAILSPTCFRLVASNAVRRTAAQESRILLDTYLEKAAATYAIAAFLRFKDKLFTRDDRLHHCVVVAPVHQTT